MELTLQKLNYVNFSRESIKMKMVIDIIYLPDKLNWNDFRQAL